MPDNEFDNLFRDKFKDAEIEPSAGLWANIEKELEPKKKRSFPIYWMAAATVAVAFTGLLLLQKKEVTVLHGKDPITADVKPDTKTDQNANEYIAPNEQHNAVAGTKKVVNNQKEIPVTLKTNAVNNNLQKTQEAVQPILPNERLAIKQQDPKPINVEPIKEAVALETPIVIASTNNKANVDQDVINETASTEKKGIRNVGDLVNYVVDKVDKRDKKLVRFNTDDDDNSSIVGINIGFLKFNKKNKDR